MVSADIKGATIKLLRGGGARDLSWTKYLFHLLTAIFFFYTLPQAKYLFHYPRVVVCLMRVLSRRSK